jgi:hypothetical protein
MEQNDRERFLREATIVRHEAQRVLRELMAAHAVCNERLRAMGRPDTLKSVTGRSSIETAMAGTKRMIESLERAIGEAQRELETAQAYEHSLSAVA